MLIKKPFLFQSPVHHNGFSLLELLFVLLIMASVVTAYTAWQGRQADHRVAQQTIDGFNQLSEAMYSYYQAKDTWPVTISDLTTEGIMVNVPNRNGAGWPYVLASPPGASSLTLSTTLESEPQALDVQQAFPANSTRDGQTVSIELPKPGLETAYDALLTNDGTTTMEGDLTFTEGAGIVGVATIEANSLNIEGSEVAQAHIALLNQMASLDCPAGISVQKGQAQCTEALTPTETEADEEGPGCLYNGAYRVKGWSYTVPGTLCSAPPCPSYSQHGSSCTTFLYGNGLFTDTVYTCTGDGFVASTASRSCRACSSSGEGGK